MKKMITFVVAGLVLATLSSSVHADSGPGSGIVVHHYKNDGTVEVRGPIGTKTDGATVRLHKKPEAPAPAPTPASAPVSQVVTNTVYVTVNNVQEKPSVWARFCNGVKRVICVAPRASASVNFISYGGSYPTYIQEDTVYTELYNYGHTQSLYSGRGYHEYPRYTGEPWNSGIRNFPPPRNINRCR